MRFAVPLIALVSASSTLASLATRQSSTSNLPTCAVQCLDNTSTQLCTATDTTCLCEDATFIESVYSCLVKSCSVSDLQGAEAAAKQLCLAVGVTLTISSTAATATSTTSTSSAASASTTSASSVASASASHKNGASVTSDINLFAGAIALLAIVGAL